MNEHLDPTGEHLSHEEHDIDRALRPLSFDDFSGQPQVLENLEIFVAAKSPGLSKTGPEVSLSLTPNSCAKICAKVVLPSPGGPCKRV